MSLICFNLFVLQRRFLFHQIGKYPPHLRPLAFCILNSCVFAGYFFYSSQVLFFIQQKKKTKKKKEERSTNAVQRCTASTITAWQPVRPLYRILCRLVAKIYLFSNRRTYQHYLILMSFLCVFGFACFPSYNVFFFFLFFLYSGLFFAAQRRHI